MITRKRGNGNKGIHLPDGMDQAIYDTNGNAVAGPGCILTGPIG